MSKTATEATTVMAIRVPKEFARQVRGVAGAFDVPAGSVIKAALSRYVLHDTRYVLYDDTDRVTDHEE